MANRVNDAEVRALIPKTVILDLDPMIGSANVMVNELAASICGASVTADRLTEVEKWLSAHFAAVVDSRLVILEERVEGVGIRLARGNNQLLGVMSTQYGMMANTLSGGCLNEMDMREPSWAFA